MNFAFKNDESGGESEGEWSEEDWCVVYICT